MKASDPAPGRGRLNWMHKGLHRRHRYHTWKCQACGTCDIRTRRYETPWGKCPHCGDKGDKSYVGFLLKRLA